MYSSCSVLCMRPCGQIEFFADPCVVVSTINDVILVFFDISIFNLILANPMRLCTNVVGHKHIDINSNSGCVYREYCPDISRAHGSNEKNRFENHTDLYVHLIRTFNVIVTISFFFSPISIIFGLN